MIKFTPQYLKKLEDLLKENGYDVRYEKGNFKSGYCILEAKKVVVINRFSTIESRIQALYEIIQVLLTDGRILADSQGLFLKAAKNKPVQEDSYIAEPVAEENSSISSQESQPSN